MATEISALIAAIRVSPLKDTRNKKFWSDETLKGHFRTGALDLWGAILDLHQDHYFKVDETSMTLKSEATSISGVPDDLFRVRLIEPRDTTSTGSGARVKFLAKPYNSPEFAGARTRDAVDPAGSQEIYFHLTGVGSPVQAPTILTGPKLSADLALRVAYNPTLRIDEFNPVPGESDNALKAWMVAYARADEREDRSPDPAWLAVYATEKQAILTRLTPRQEQDETVVDDLFAGVGHFW